MAQGKKKRSVDKVYALFPDEVSHGGKNSAAEGTSKPSLSRAWMRCGDGFDESSGGKKSKSSEKKLHAVRQLAKSFLFVEETSTEESGKDPADIVWSSSDSDSSNDGCSNANSQPNISEVSPQNSGRLPDSSEMSASMEGCSGGVSDDLPITDWQDDSDLECGLDSCLAYEKSDSLVEISDSESSTSDVLVLQQPTPEPSKALSYKTSRSNSIAMQSLLRKAAIKVVDIVEYSSDEEANECVEAADGQDVPIHGESVLISEKKSASDWVKTAQILLQTPDKKTDKTFKTPEDSAKKKKRFVRGGLAETLNRLQNRERSAITFWRHQSGSNCKIPLGDKSGTLLVKIIEVHEECAMWIASCNQVTDLDNINNHSIPSGEETTKMKVLFSRETAAQVKPRQNDIIQIFPPWQKLTLRDQNTSVIINTYFSQKIIPEKSEDLDDKECSPGFLSVMKRSVPLTVTFQTDSIDNLSYTESKPQVSPSRAAIQGTLFSQQKEPSATLTVNDSLLDLVETQGAAGWRGTCIRVVVQRVYGLMSKDSPRCRHHSSSRVISDTATNTQMPDFRLGLLIQDAYGMFSEVLVDVSDTSAKDIEKYCQTLEGKSCCFSGLKILQRTTKGRAPGLFSLIDSLWPPLAPIKIHGQSQDQAQMPYNLPSPSFCYVFAIHYEEGSDCIKPEDTVSDLYLPAVIHNLEEILQVVVLSQRCSFWATVIYVRPEIYSNLKKQKAFWVYVTDATLQMTSEASRLPRVLSVCVLPSCAVDSRVLDVLGKKTHCNIFFKDAVKENGKIICVERTVLSLQKPPLSQSPGINKLTAPVRLDKLDSSTEESSLCFVTGIIVGVNEKESYSWPVCNQCGRNNLQLQSSDRRAYICRQCNENVHSPVIKMQLEIFMKTESRPECKVRLKLQQETISSILSSCSSEDGRYEVRSVLGRQVGPIPCYIQRAAGNMEMEEICLLQAETTASHGS